VRPSKHPTPINFSSKLLTRDEARRIAGEYRQAACVAKNGREAVLEAKREWELSVRKRRLPDVHAATLRVARDFPL